MKHKVVMPKAVLEPEEVDDGKVTILFGTQTGTAEGFAKELAQEGKARHDKAIFNVIDFDDYVGDDEEYKKKLKERKFGILLLSHISIDLVGGFKYGDGEPTNNAAKFYKWSAEIKYNNRELPSP